MNLMTRTALQGGGLRGELDILGNGLRRVGASLCGSIENLVSHCTQTLSTSGLATSAACKPMQIGRHRIKVWKPRISSNAYVIAAPC